MPKQADIHNEGGNPVASAKQSTNRSLEDLVAVRIIRIAEILSRLATRAYERRFGLRNTDLRILNILDGGEPISVNEISRRTHIDKAWISRSIRQLENKKLVKRKSSRTDSRNTLVTLTAASRKILADVRPIAYAREKALMKKISTPGFRKELDQLLVNAEALLAADSE